MFGVLCACFCVLVLLVFPTKVQAQKKHTRNSRKRDHRRHSHTQNKDLQGVGGLPHKGHCFWGVFPVFFYVLSSLVSDVIKFIVCDFVSDLFVLFVVAVFVFYVYVFVFWGCLLFSLMSNRCCVFCLFLWFVSLGVLLLLFCVCVFGLVGVFVVLVMRLFAVVLFVLYPCVLVFFWGGAVLFNV